MKITELSSQYTVRKMTADDIERIYELSIGNPLFYQYCPPFVTKESILTDIKALPPGTTFDDKFYIGFFHRMNRSRDAKENLRRVKTANAFWMRDITCPCLLNRNCEPAHKT